MNEQGTIIIYGSYGYTGSLIVDECKERNLHVILAGRNKAALHSQSTKTGFPYEVVALSDSVALRNLLSKGEVVIHCAGPFQHTARIVAEMCLHTRTHYTDITGEYQVFELLASLGEKAKAAGIMLMPGTGFDVVPSDCLALHLKKELPSATHLQLAFKMAGGGVSRGTAKTMVENLGKGSVIRRDGRLVHVPMGAKIQSVDFGGFTSRAVNIPWGDVSSAWYSTGIPNIEVYLASPENVIVAAKLSRYFNWILRSKMAKAFLQKQVDKNITGPVPQKRLTAKSFLWGAVGDGAGRSYSATIDTINGYSLTAKTSVLIAKKILDKNLKQGFQTPSMAYGPDLILEIGETVRRPLK